MGSHEDLDQYGCHEFVEAHVHFDAVGTDVCVQEGASYVHGPHLAAKISSDEVVAVGAGRFSYSSLSWPSPPATGRAKHLDQLLGHLLHLSSCQPVRCLESRLV